MIHLLCIDGPSSEIHRWEKGDKLILTHEVNWTPTGDPRTEREGLEQLRKFPAETIATTVGDETNPEDILCGG